MNRINQKGMELIQYKIELRRDYPKLIKDSLILALEQMVENKVLDLDTYMAIKDDTLAMDSFEDYLLTKQSFTKTEEEIFKEFEVLRELFDAKLTEYEVEGLKSESVIDKDSILITKRFSIDDAFTMEYFGVEEADVPKLMKRRNFVEKFAVLRLTTIFKQLKEKISYPEDLFKVDISLVYADKEENGYSVDFMFEVNIEEIEKQENIEELCKEIKALKKESEEFYAQKMVF